VRRVAVQQAAAISSNTSSTTRVPVVFEPNSFGSVAVVLVTGQSRNVLLSVPGSTHFPLGLFVPNVQRLEAFASHHTFYTRTKPSCDMDAVVKPSRG
jgi:hypothetical protein